MKSFAEQLPMIAGGALNDELTQALADVLEYIDTHGGKSRKSRAKWSLARRSTKWASW